MAFDTGIKDDMDLTIRNAELVKEMVKAKQGKDPEAAREAKNELREFRQGWRKVHQAFAAAAGEVTPEPVTSSVEAK
jgi:hypothetical protein